jgi:unsaturated rhamnogalacturonyl hydrolase
MSLFGEIQMKLDCLFSKARHTFLVSIIATFLFIEAGPGAQAFQNPTTNMPASNDAVQPVKTPSTTTPSRRSTSPGAPDAHLAYVPGKAPKFWSVATAETIMARYPDYREAYWKPWSYVQGYVFYGFEMLYRSTGDRKYLDYMKRYVDEFVDEKGNFHGDKLTNLDNLMTGNSIVALYGYTHDERYKAAATQFRRVFDTYPRSSDGQFWHGSGSANMWIDGIFMGQMFLLRYGKLVGDSEYAWDEVTRQITVFSKHCLKGDSGLYLHAWTENLEKAKWANPKTGLSPEVWSEGLGWYALIISEALALLPKDHPKRAEVEDIYRRLASGLKRTQDVKTGGWFMIVDKGDQFGNWIDPSGTAMFVYAIQRGIDLGLLPSKEYAPVVANGYKGLLGFARINERGLVDIDGGGDGISIKPDYATYVNVKRVVNAKEAVGGFLWATAIVEKPKLEKLNKR